MSVPVRPRALLRLLFLPAALVAAASFASAVLAFNLVGDGLQDALNPRGDR